MAKFEVGQTVWVKPLTVADTIVEVLSDGRHYILTHKHGVWPEDWMVSTADHDGYTTWVQAETEKRDQERIVKRYAIAFSKPLECTFHTHLDYRRAYIGWAESWGGEQDRPDWVNRQYWKFMLMSEDE